MTDDLAGARELLDEDGEDSELRRVADEALYAAKAAGRDRLRTAAV